MLLAAHHILEIAGLGALLAGVIGLWVIAMVRKDNGGPFRRRPF